MFSLLIIDTKGRHRTSTTHTDREGAAEELSSFMHRNPTLKYRIGSAAELVDNLPCEIHNENGVWWEVIVSQITPLQEILDTETGASR